MISTFVKISLTLIDICSKVKKVWKKSAHISCNSDLYPLALSRLFTSQLPIYNNQPLSMIIIVKPFRCRGDLTSLSRRPLVTLVSFVLHSGSNVFGYPITAIILFPSSFNLKSKSYLISLIYKVRPWMTALAWSKPSLVVMHFYARGKIWD